MRVVEAGALSVAPAHKQAAAMAAEPRVSETHPLLQRAQAALLSQATNRRLEIDGILREKRNELKVRCAALSCGHAPS